MSTNPKHRQMNFFLKPFNKFIRRNNTQKECIDFVNDKLLGAVDFHTIPINELCERLSTSEEDGLSQAFAINRLKKTGLNLISPPKSYFVKKLVQALFGGFSTVLWIAAFLSILAYKPLGGNNPDITNLALAILIITVLCLHISFHIWQRYSSHKVMKSINKMIPSSVLVTRDGAQKMIPTTDIVEGDLVSLKLGIKVPADIRIIESKQLKIDRSMISGENEPVKSVEECTDNNYLVSRNIALMGTLVTNGEGKGIVIQTGDDSVMGRIAKLSTNSANDKILLMKEINLFIKIIATLALLTGLFVVIIWAGWLHISYPTFLSAPEILINVIGVLVAFLPTGLPISVTLTLTIIARKMSEEKMVIKDLDIVEALGSIHIIASDKTGTLTKNRMSVMSIVLDKSYKLQDCFELWDSYNLQFMEFIAISALCNSSSFNPEHLNLPINQREIYGNSTDAGILRFSERFKLKKQFDKEFEKCFEIPFNSKNKWMMAIFRPKMEDNEFYTTKRVMMIKGAPDVLLPCCEYYLDEDGRQKPLDFVKKKFFKEERKYWSKKGQRILLLARCIIEDDIDLTNFSLNLDALIPNLCLVGQCGLIDPPRDGIRDTLAQFKSAGIKVMMITGDFSLTAVAVASQVGIFTNYEFDTLANIKSNNRPDIEICISDDKILGGKKRSLLINGPEIETLVETDWDRICEYDEIVFARATPENKLAVVQQFQHKNLRIAITGDGVNDAPALRAADVGISMGGGSSVAMEASNIILIEDNFNSILEAINYGRLAFNNLKKVILYLLPAGSFSETIPILMNVLLGVPLPLSAFLMIIICVVTDVLSALALINEKPESNLMVNSPRNAKHDRLADGKLILQAYFFIGFQEALFAHAIYFYYLHTQGFKLSNLFLIFDKWKDGYMGMTHEQLNKTKGKGQTIYFVALVIMQCLGNLFATRTRKTSTFKFNPFSRKNFNSYLIASILATISISALVVYLPWINNMFNTQPIEYIYWLIPLIFALTILTTEEIRKFLVKRYPKSLLAKLAW